MKWFGRTVTADEWDRLDEQHAEAYAAVEERVLAEWRAAWEAEFGGSFPFKPSGNALHEEVLRRMKSSSS